MKQVLLLGLNDLRLTLRDRPAFIWMLAFPILMMWFIGGIGGQQRGTPPIGLGVMDEDGGWLSEAFVEDLEDEALALGPYDGSESTQEKVRTLVIPEGFTRDVLAGRQRALRLEKQPGQSEEYSLAAQVHLVRAIARTLGRLVEIDPALSAGDAAAARQAFDQLAQREPLVQLSVSTAGRGRPVPTGFAQSVPGMLTFMVLMMTSIYGAVFLTIEKRSGTLRRQVCLPLGRRKLLLGKLAGRLLIAGFQILGLVLAGRFLFQVSWGNSPAGLALMLGSYAVAVAGLSVLLGAWLRTPEQASIVGWIAAMVLAALGGCMWPAEVMPAWLRTAAHVFPTAWAMDGFHALISFGRGVDGVWLPAAVLLLFGAACTAVGARFLRHEA